MTTTQTILLILQTALIGLSAVPQTAAAAAEAQAFVQIIQSAMVAYKTATGQALDLTKLHTEAQV